MADATVGGPSSDDSVSVAAPRIEHLREPLGLGVDRPRLSWTTTTGRQDWRQAAYEVEATRSAEASPSSTGRIESDESVLVAWPFEPLTSRESATVRVRGWGVDGSASDWSTPTTLEAGLLEASDWSAGFISPDWDEAAMEPRSSPLLRRGFVVRTRVTWARLYVTALGVYEPWLNGVVVGDHVLAPGWTSYDHRLRYQTFDVTAQLREGDNVLGAMLGDGWYRGRLGWHGGRRDIYGNRLALLAQLEIHYADGTTDCVATDEGWRAATGPILANDLYDGETYDARLERPGWAATGFDDGDWAGVRVVDRDLSTLVAPAGPPVRRIELMAPVSISTSPTGRTVLDFGQNLVGWLRLSIRGSAGQTITLHHAEVLQNGDLCLRPLRQAKATDQYICRGEGVEIWEPRFTFHGFRYAEIEGWHGEVSADDVRAVVCHSDLERTGWFECSDPLVNRLHENALWGMRGNFLDVPTDCPQRDERFGWTGDIQVFSPTACFLYDAAGFLTSWLADLAADQGATGAVPFIVPNTLGEPIAAAAWGDAAAVVPWVLYQRFGDTSVLATQFESMRRWVDHVAGLAGPTRLWSEGFQFGDWLDPSAPPDRPMDGATDSHLVASAYFARSSDLVAQAAGVLGRVDEQAYYKRLADEIRTAFAREYATPNGRVVSDSGTAYSLALQFGLLPSAEQRQHAGHRLAALTREGNYRITTGFAGTPLILDALCDADEVETAFRLLLERGCPSWLYSVTMGATTIWERWDSLLPDGTVNPGEMTSFNHYAFGAVADWLHRVVAGLASATPGYRRLSIQPRPGHGIDRAQARHQTPYGLAEVSWTLVDGVFRLDLIVPPNSTASVFLPGRESEGIDVGSGTHHWMYAYTVD